MGKIDPAAAIEHLLADEDMVTLCELQRTGDEVLDVIALSENQHSDILGWMLDPREGHGQGDQILRDLLTAASMKVARGESGLEKGSATSRFFKAWPPSRIRTSGFGSAFYARELGMKAAERVDLFVIDPQNKYILLIENKAGAAHREAQLKLYRKCFDEMVDENIHLRGYSHVFIALDRDFDAEESAGHPCSESWLHMGYEWLKTSAGRALLQVERGNAAAKLVVGYCNRQSDWEAPQAKKCIELAAILHQRHPDAIRALVEPSAGRIEKEWLGAKDPNPSLLFTLQNKGVVELLRETKGMAYVKTGLHRLLPKLPLSSIEHARAWLDVCPTGWERFRGAWWPLVMNIRYSDQTKTKFNLRLIWNAGWVDDDYDAQALRSRLKEAEPRFGAFEDSQFRRVPIDKGLSLAELAKEIEQLNVKLEAAAPSC
ncbi:hypothetical protein CATMQ487_35290 [Sphaerotilus microaerophilus]|uniref:PD-(D/E)XK nuclease superfamily protein n=2 Tax=Sphaerotilus microaerophilus TaxID=2914710 RepID=A0ABN6PR74_9BURK|nr:hypothetical protein CATMQ487_35290 [Sphaerotilus sp. FB-5]